MMLGGGLRPTSVTPRGGSSSIQPLFSSQQTASFVTPLTALGMSKQHHNPVVGANPHNAIQTPKHAPQPANNLEHINEKVTTSV